MGKTLDEAFVYMRAYRIDKKREDGPEPAEPDGVDIGDAFEVFAGHSQVGQILEVEVAGTESQRVHIHVRYRRLRL